MIRYEITAGHRPTAEQAVRRNTVIAGDTNTLIGLYPYPVVADVHVVYSEAMRYVWRGHECIVRSAQYGIALGKYLDVRLAAFYIHELVAEVIVLADVSARLTIAVAEMGDARKLGHGILDEVIAHAVKIDRFTENSNVVETWGIARQIQLYRHGSIIALRYIYRRRKGQ